MPSEHPVDIRCPCPACATAFALGFPSIDPQDAIAAGKEMHETLDKYFGVQETLSERGSRYGDFADNANISQQLQRIIQDAPSFSRMTDLQREGLTAIMQKIARILNGDPNYADNWHDIQGYARLVEERLPK